MACSSRLGGGLRGQGSRAGPAHLTVGAAAWQVSLGQTSNRPWLATGTGKTSIAVLAHVAYALQPIPREERAAHARLYIHSKCTSKQQLFLNFVLQHYVTLGVQELALDKLTPLLQLRYQNSIADAVADLGRPEEISQLFAGFQRYLYEPSA
jgi:hypothetical protein